MIGKPARLRNAACGAAFGISTILVGGFSASAADLEFYFPVGVNAPAAKTIEELTLQWDEAHPEHTVKAIYAGNYGETTTKALAAARAGKPPHVAVLLAIDIFTLVDEDVVVPISDIANSEDDQKWLDGFYEAFMIDTKFEGKIWSVPFQRSTPVLYYNKEAFTNAGLDPDQPPKSWDEMVEMGKKLVVKDADGKVTQWGTRIPSNGLAGAWLYGGLVISNGSHLSDDSGAAVHYNTPEAVEALEWLVSLSRDEAVMAPGVIDWGATPKAFLEGQTASIWTSTGNLANINKNATFDYGVAFLPGGKGPGAPTGGGNFYVFKDTSVEEKAASVEFIKWMTAPEQAAKWAIATGYVAPRADTWETPVMKEYTAEVPHALVARDQIKHAKRELASFQRARVTQFLVEAIEGSINGQVEPKAALDAAQTKADDVLKDYR